MKMLGKGQQTGSCPERTELSKHHCCHFKAGLLLMTSDLDPKLTIVLMSVFAMVTSRMEPVAHSARPPAASTTRASGAASYSNLSFAGADLDTGFANTPPPCNEASQCVTSIVVICKQNAVPKILNIWQAVIPFLGSARQSASAGNLPRGAGACKCQQGVHDVCCWSSA